MAASLASSVADHAAALLAREKLLLQQVTRERERFTSQETELLELKTAHAALIAAHAKLSGDCKRLEKKLVLTADDCDSRLAAMRSDLMESLRQTNEYAHREEIVHSGCGRDAPPSYDVIQHFDADHEDTLWRAHWMVHDNTLKSLYQASREDGREDGLAGKGFLLAAFQLLVRSAKNIRTTTARQHAASAILAVCIRTAVYVEAVHPHPAEWDIPTRVSVQRAWIALDEELLNAVEAGVSAVQRPRTPRCANCGTTCNAVTNDHDNVWGVSKSALVRDYLHHAYRTNEIFKLWVSEDMCVLAKTLEWLDGADIDGYKRVLVTPGPNLVGVLR